MQTVVKNPDPRLLPQGWAEHFDSQRKIWYYIDLDSVPPRASFVHPCDELRRIKGKGRMTISHELAPEESSFSGSDTTTFAQRLYATSVSASLPQPPSSGSSISSTGLATHLEHPRSSSSPGLASGDSSSSNPASSTYSISPSPLPAEQSNSDRPKLFGPRQPRNSRHRSASSPAVRSPLAAEDTDIYGTPTLYHPVVVASTTPPGRRITSLEVKRADNQASIGSGVKPTGAPDCIPKALPPIPNATDISKPPATPLIMAPPTIRRLAKRYSAVTEDNIYVAPVPPGVSSSPALTQERPLPLDVALIHTNIDPPSLDAQRFIQRPPTSLEQAILQPKPIKPLKGVSLSLQNQVVESSTPPPVVSEAFDVMKKNRTSQLLKKMGFGISRTSESEQESAYLRQSARPTGGYETPNRYTPSLSDSFVFVDSNCVDGFAPNNPMAPGIFIEGRAFSATPSKSYIPVYPIL